MVTGVRAILVIGWTSDLYESLTISICFPFEIKFNLEKKQASHTKTNLDQMRYQRSVTLSEHTTQQTFVTLRSKWLTDTTANKYLSIVCNIQRVGIYIYIYPEVLMFRLLLYTGHTICMFLPPITKWEDNGRLCRSPWSIIHETERKIFKRIKWNEHCCRAVSQHWD